MGYLGFKPCPALAAFVRLIWTYSGDGVAGGIERVLPTGSADVIINLRDEPLAVFRPGSRECFEHIRGPLFYGPHATYFVIDRTAHAAVCGTHFVPGAAGAFLPSPLSELQNAAVPLELLWGGMANELAGQVVLARTIGEQVRAVERALLAQLERTRACRSVVVWALEKLRYASQPLSIAALSDTAGLSTRRFGQLFVEDVGLPPKLFQRVTRFQSALALAEDDDARSWAHVAAECGYYDQAHFIHDFQAFTGLSPTAYIAQRGPWRNHVPFEGQ